MDYNPATTTVEHQWGPTGEWIGRALASPVRFDPVFNIAAALDAGLKLEDLVHADIRSKWAAGIRVSVDRTRVAPADILAEVAALFSFSE